MRRVLVLTLVLLAAACAQPDPYAARLAGTARALGEASDPGPVSFRYNPTDCSCPAWEVAVDGGWVRVDLTAPADATATLAGLRQRAMDDLADGHLATYPLKVSLDSNKPRFCDNGTPYYEMELLAD
jgi:hypothetical protein